MLDEEFTDVFEELVDAADFVEEPRRLDEILRAEQEFFDRVWHERHLVSMTEIEAGEPADYATGHPPRGAGERRAGQERWPDVGPVGTTSSGACGTGSSRPFAGCWEQWDFLDT